MPAIKLVATIGLSIGLLQASMLLAARLLVIPWKRALMGVERGHYDRIPMLLKTAERGEYRSTRYPCWSERIWPGPWKARRAAIRREDCR